MAYTLISEQVLGSAAASVTFSSIPGTYKDLVLEVACTYPGADVSMIATFNGDSAANYSYTILSGNGTAAASSRASGVAYFVVGQPSNSSTEISIDMHHIESYANTSVYKTVLGRSNRSSSTVAARVALWRSTAAITSIQLSNFGGASFATASTFRLWGIS